MIPGRSSITNINSPKLSLIIPACNEEGYIIRCLESILNQKEVNSGELEVIVVANNCSDNTVSQAQKLEGRFAERGWRFRILDIPESGKANALNLGDAEAQASTRGYLDADIVLGPRLIFLSLKALTKADAIFVTARIQIAPARSWLSHRYGAIFQRLPFMQPGSASGAGWFAVNAAGRKRWQSFPQIISDDTFVRWHFIPRERVEVDAVYYWPLAEGFNRLVKVRRRQDAGVRELRVLYPELERNESIPAVRLIDHLRLLLDEPIGYVIYASVQLWVRLGDHNQAVWTRGR